MSAEGKLHEIVIGHCSKCRPDEWRVDPGDHRCAAEDEDSLYGTVLVSCYSPTSGWRYNVRTWPMCEECGERYCTYCGEHEWRQCL